MLPQLKLVHTLCFILLLAACTPVEKDQGKKVFYYNEAEGVTSLDPAFASNYENIWWVSQIFNGLVQMDADLNVVPCIAKDWSISDDGLQYIFHLRDDVLFQKNDCFKSENRIVKSSDFEYSFNRVVDPNVASPGLWIFKYLDKNIPFETPNDRTFIINLEQQFTPFLGMLTMPYCNVVPPEAVEFYGEDFRANPVGTGPFQLNFWIENNRLTLVKNPNYFEKDQDGNALPYLDAVSVSFVKDRSTMFLDFLKGKYDMISSIHPAYKDELLNQDGTLAEAYADKFYLIKQPYLNTEYLGVMVDDSLSLSNESPMHNPKVRRALSHAINRKAMVRYIRNNTCSPAYAGFIPEGLLAFDENQKGNLYDPEKARALLQEAGYQDGIGEITLSTTSSYVELCQFIQHELEQIGVQVKVDVLPVSNHRRGVSNSEILFFRKSWIADYPDAENFLALFYSKNFSPKGANYTHYANAQYDSLYEKSLVVTNPTERVQLYREMNQIAIDDMPLIPLIYGQVVRFANKDVTGLESDAMNTLKLKRVRKK